LQFNHSFDREALGEMDKEAKTGTPLDWQSLLRFDKSYGGEFGSSTAWTW
jgi:hypothetical protein